MATFSFEMYPPRGAAGERVLYDTLRHLTATHPEFISVTYGASGSSRGESLGVLKYLLRETDVEPMAHLTCVGSSYAEASALIRQFLDAGVTNFLALRGDPPEGYSENDTFLGDLGSAGELVQLIHRVQQERVPFVEHAMPGRPNACRLTGGPAATVAVAAFPNGHPHSRSGQQDVDTLLAKQAAGATLAITQLFFHADDYLAFVDRAREAGVTMRILPGLMPVLSAARLRRIVQLTAEALPADLLQRLESADQPAVVGIDHAIHLGRTLLDGGAPGLHVFTFNRHEAPLAVLRGCGVLDHVEPDRPSRSSPDFHTSSSAPSLLQKVR